MSEYIEIETEATEDPAVMLIYTNQLLTDSDSEHYDSAAEMEVGSPLAQMLAAVPGITRLEIEGTDMRVTGDPETPWHIIVADISAVVKEFFL